MSIIFEKMERANLVKYLEGMKDQLPDVDLAGSIITALSHLDRLDEYELSQFLEQALKLHNILPSSDGPFLRAAVSRAIILFEGRLYNYVGPDGFSGPEGVLVDKIIDDYPG